MYRDLLKTDYLNIAGSVLALSEFIRLSDSFYYLLIFDSDDRDWHKRPEMMA